MSLLTLEQQTNSLARYLPGGRAFGSKNINGTVLRSLLAGMAEELVRADGLIGLLRTDVVPSDTVFFIEEWEQAMGIPDDCFSGTGTDEERRTAIVSKLALFNVQTRGDFEALALKFGFAVQVLPGKDAEIQPTVTFPNDKTARNTIVVNFSTLGGTQSFQYEFPFPFGSSAAALLQCLLVKLKPSNCNMLFTNF